MDDVIDRTRAGHPALVATISDPEAT
jgi:hypothetical protein